jgi:hypothetical protein
MSSISSSPLVKRKANSIYNDNFERQFALCETCLWSATIFKSKAKKKIVDSCVCPVCLNNTVCFIPLMYIRLYNAIMCNLHSSRKQRGLGAYKNE